MNLSPNNFVPPYTAAQIQQYNGAYNPVGVKLDSYTLAFFRRTLWQRLFWFLEYSGLPETWDVPYINFSLLWCGYCGVMDGGEYGPIPQWGTLSGWGIYCQPTRLSVVNKFFQRPLMRIGEECELLRMTPDYRGIWDTVDFYSVKLAMISKLFDMSAISSRVSWAVAAKNKAAAQTIKAIEDKAQAGETLVVFDKALLPDDDQVEGEPWQYFHRDIREGFICAEALDIMTTIYHQFDTEMGIPNANTQKKERMVVDEVNRNNGETESRVRGFVENLEKSFEKVNKMFELDCHVKLRGEGEKIGSDNQPAESV